MITFKFYMETDKKSKNQVEKWLIEPKTPARSLVVGNWEVVRPGFSSATT